MHRMSAGLQEWLGSSPPPSSSPSFLNPSRLSTSRGAQINGNEEGGDGEEGLRALRSESPPVLGGREASNMLWAMMRLKATEIATQGSRGRPDPALASNLLSTRRTKLPHGVKDLPPALPMLLNSLITALSTPSSSSSDEDSSSNLGPREIVDVFWSVAVAAACLPSQASTGISDAFNLGSDGTTRTQMKEGGSRRVKIWDLLPLLKDAMMGLQEQDLSSSDLARLRRADLVLRAAAAVNGGCSASNKQRLGSHLEWWADNVDDVDKGDIDSDEHDPSWPYASFLPPHLSRAASAAARDESQRSSPSTIQGSGRRGTAWLSEVRAVLHELYSGLDQSSQTSSQDHGCEEGVDVLGGAARADLSLSWPPPAPSPSSPFIPCRDQVALQRCASPAAASHSIDDLQLSSVSHYTSNGPHAETGDAWIEKRLLELGGLRPVFLPRHLWRAWMPSPASYSHSNSRLKSTGGMNKWKESDPAELGSSGQNGEEIMLLYSLIEEETAKADVGGGRKKKSKGGR